MSDLRQPHAFANVPAITTGSTAASDGPHVCRLDPADEFRMRQDDGNYIVRRNLAADRRALLDEITALRTALATARKAALTFARDYYPRTTIDPESKTAAEAFWAMEARLK